MDVSVYEELQIAIDREVSKSHHNSRMKLRIQVSNVEQRDNIEFYLH